MSYPSFGLPVAERVTAPRRTAAAARSTCGGAAGRRPGSNAFEGYALQERPAIRAVAQTTGLRTA